MDFNANTFHLEPHTEQWHPKLTPYRSLVLFTTIGLGSAKAYAVSQNLLGVAISIEWITGVVIFSILFILGLYESDPPPSRLLQWLLTSDLVPVFFRMVSWSPPQYRTDELPRPVHDEHLNEHIHFPLITGYRLLTSVSVTLFGVAKAYFSYQNEAPVTNAFEWILGIIITSILYILGLYENNPINRMPYFFFANHSVAVYSVLWLTIHMIGTYLCSLATALSITSGMLSIPPFLSSLTIEEFRRLGGDLMSLGFSLFPFFALIVLPLRMFNFCLTHSPFPLVRAIQTIYLKVGHLVYTRFRMDVWPQWTKACGLSFIKMVVRMRRTFDGILMLGGFAASVLFAGITSSAFSLLLFLFIESPSDSMLGYMARFCCILILSMMVFELIVCTIFLFFLGLLFLLFSR